MKTEGILCFVFLLIYLNACNSDQSRETADKYSIQEMGSGRNKLQEYEHNFGKITEGEKVAHIFVFENKGPGSLVISSASTSCGCTVTNTIRNQFRSEQEESWSCIWLKWKSGNQTKTISVRSNSKTKVVVLKITAEVISKRTNHQSLITNHQSPITK